MGGTFNPPHNGHLHAAQQAVKALQFDRLLLIPDNIPPHKTMPEHSGYQHAALGNDALAWRKKFRMRRSRIWN